jgi:hypothetical protein
MKHATKKLILERMNAKTQTQEITEYIGQLQKLLNQSTLIKQEIKEHIKFSRLQGRIGAISQQLEFIRSLVLPKTAEEKAKYFKHNKLALKLINRHIAEIEKDTGETRLKKLEEEESQWLVIEELREETLQNLEHIEAALKEAELTSEQENDTNDTKEIIDIMVFEAEVSELADKTELLLQEMEVHSHLHEPIFEQIHNLFHELQFIKLHAYSRNHEHETHGPTEHIHHDDFLHHHYQSLHEINAHLFHLHNHWGHLLHELHGEDHNALELKQVHEEIKHTIEQFEEKIEEIEENRIHYMQHPGAHIVPVKFDKK